MTYKLTDTTVIIRLSDGVNIPSDPGNLDYAGYLQWLVGGNTPDPVDIPSLASLKAAALTAVRALRASLFPTLAGLQSEALARGNTADALAIAAVQQSCRDITGTDLSACVTEADIDAVFMRVWSGIVAKAPLTVKAAFAGLTK